jgi:hypothetical protein
VGIDHSRHDKKAGGVDGFAGELALRRERDHLSVRDVNVQPPGKPWSDDFAALDGEVNPWGAQTRSSC